MCESSSQMIGALKVLTAMYWLYTSYYSALWKSTGMHGIFFIPIVFSFILRLESLKLYNIKHYRVNR